MINIKSTVHGMLDGLGIGFYHTYDLLLAWQTLGLVSPNKKLIVFSSGGTHASLDPLAHDHYARYISSSCLIITSGVIGMGLVGIGSLLMTPLFLALILLAFIISWIGWKTCASTDYYCRQYLWYNKVREEKIPVIDSYISLISILVSMGLLLSSMILMVVLMPLWQLSVIPVFIMIISAFITFIPLMSLAHLILFAAYQAIKDGVGILQIITKFMRHLGCYLLALILTIVITCITLPVILLISVLNSIMGLFIGGYLGNSYASNYIHWKKENMHKKITGWPQNIIQKINAWLGRNEPYEMLTGFFPREDFARTDIVEFAQKGTLYQSLIENCPEKFNPPLPSLSEDEAFYIPLETNQETISFYADYKQLLMKERCLDIESCDAFATHRISLLVPYTRNSGTSEWKIFLVSAITMYKTEALEGWLTTHNTIPHTDTLIEKKNFSMYYIENIEIKAGEDFETAMKNSMTLQKLMKVIKYNTQHYQESLLYPSESIGCW